MKQKRKFGERIKSMKKDADMVNKKRSLAAYVQNNLIRLARFSVFCFDRMLILGVFEKLFEAAQSSKKGSHITVKLPKVF